MRAMSLFDTIKNAIFGHGSSVPPVTQATATPGSTPVPGAGGTPSVQSPPAAGGTSAPTPQAISAVALEGQLTQLAATNGQKLNWQTSIVDLMKLVGLDPSLANRKQLAHELGYVGDANDSATMNVWLHKTVMDKLAASGGNVSADLKA